MAYKVQVYNSARVRSRIVQRCSVPDFGLAATTSSQKKAPDREIERDKTLQCAHRERQISFFVLNLVRGSEVATGTQRVWVESPQQGNGEHSIGGCKYLVIEVRAMQDDMWRLKTFQVGGADSLWMLSGMEAYLYNGVLSSMWVMGLKNFVHPVEANWKPIEDLSESVAKVISS